MLPSEPGHSATVLVALATRGVTPSPTMAGKVSSVPPPAIAFTAPAAAAGAVNAIAGGGTLLTFPAIVGLGVTPLVANATSTVALWPGSLGSMWGYRHELTSARRWVISFTAPSLAGGALGAWLL